MAAVREEICLLAEKEIKDLRPGGICLRLQADFPGPFSRAVRGRHIGAGDPLARYKRDGGHAVHSDAAAPYSPVFVLPCACLQIREGRMAGTPSAEKGQSETTREPFSRRGTARML